MTELDYLDEIYNALTAMQGYLDQTDNFAGVVAACGAIVLSLFALCGCLVGFFSGIELLKIWRM